MAILLSFATPPQKGEPVLRRASSFRAAVPRLALLVLLTWAAQVLFSPLTLLLIPIGMILLWVRDRWRGVLIYAAVLPSMAAFVFGVISYCSGTARLMAMGLPGMGFYDLHPTYRCESATGGCLVNGGEFLTDTPNNLAIMLMTALFGPQPGAYRGEYPTQVEAETAVRGGSPLRTADLQADVVVVSGQRYRLDHGVGCGLLPVGYEVDFQDTALPMLPPLMAAKFGQQCLVLDIPRRSHDPVKYPRAGMIVLVDVKTGRPFAYYGVGDYYQRFPPVTWRK